MPRQRSTDLHDGWRFAQSAWQVPGARSGYSIMEWLEARVPGHVHLDLVENGVIGHPFVRMQELGCQWVDEEDFSYESTFSFRADPELPRRCLRFEGLDTVCRVSLNGALLAEHDNMFVPLELDVTSRLLDGPNVLRVDFASAARIGRARRARYFAAEGIADDCERFEERAFVRKVQCMFGWDWGPRLPSAGIFRPVRLVEYVARLGDVHVQQQHAPSGAVTVTAHAQSPEGTRAIHIWDGGPPTSDGAIVTIAEPKLWNPTGIGDQHLYELETFLVPNTFSLTTLARDGAAARRRLAELALDQRSARVGLRRLKLVREADQFGESFEFEVNGRRVYALGANWIPDHCFPSLVTRDSLRTRLLAARNSGMNMLRVWGGGLYESDDFYDLCDELGLLVWQDFPFACSYYPDSDEFCAEVAVEARANIVRLRGHASLALWCGNNENLQMFQQRWGDPSRHPTRYYGEQIYDVTLPALLAEFDPQTPYVPTSPYGGEDCQQGGIGDQHYWDVWHGRGDWIHYADSTGRFSSEYGFASAPSLRAFAEIFPNDASSLPPQARSLAALRSAFRDPIVRWHDKTLKGYETWMAYVRLHYPEPLTLEDWCYYSQLNQRDAIRAAVEHYRRSEFCRGSLIWQLNDCWPVQSWSLIDSIGQPKPALIELERLYAPALLSIKRRDGLLELWGNYDNAVIGARLSDELSVTVVSLVSGATLAKFASTAELSVDERACLLTVDVSKFDPASTLVLSEWGNLHAWSLLGEPKALRLPPPTTLSVELDGRGRLTLSSPGPLVDLWLFDDDGTRHFAKNLITSSGPSRLSLTYEGDGSGLRARSLAGSHPLEISIAAAL